MAYNPYNQFMEQSVLTMSPIQLIVSLYDKAEQELKKAVYYIDNNQLENANNSITKVENIVATLNSSLKTKYEISDNLAALYDYFAKRLIEANIKKDKDILNELIPFFQDLKESFSTIGRKE